MTNVCPICSTKRANIRLVSCGHTFHDRCLFPWPCTTCPVAGCKKEILNFEFIKIEEFYHRDQKYECSDLMHVFGINRRGRWTEEEYEYALALIEAFNAGLVHLPESLKLGSFLCKMLQCCSARLSSKIRKGKKVFHSKRIQEGVAADTFEIAHYRSVQQKLSDAEEEFLTKIATGFDIEEAAVLSYHIQHSWQKGFLASTHFEANKHKFLNPYHDTGGRKSGIVRQPANGCSDNFPVKNMLFSCLRSVAHHFTSWPLRDNVLLYLEGVTREFPSSIALALHVQSRSVLHASSSFQSILSQFISKDSFLTVDDLEFVFKNHGDLVNAVTDRPKASSASSSDSEDCQQQVNRTFELILVDDGRCACSADVLFLGSLSLSVLRFRRISTSPYDDVADVVFEEEYNEEAVVRALGAYSDGGTGWGSEGMSISSQSSLSLPAHTQMLAVRDNNLNSASSSSLSGKKGRADYGKRQFEFVGATAEDAFKRIPTALSAPSSIYSSSAMSLQRACGSFLLTSDKHNVPQQVGSNLMRIPAASDEPDVCPDLYAMIGEDIDLSETGFRAEEILPRNPIVNIVYSGRTGIKRGGSKHKPTPVMSSASSSNNPTLLSATTTVDAPPYVGMSQAPSSAPNVPTSFESILQSLLRVIPFHVVEIWVPVQLEDGATVMLFGASAALDKDLHGWSQYSRNFSFNPDVGLPGRVATARIAESRPDVASLSLPTFLRAEMAGSLGIHAACGLPFFTGSKCDAVVVFYSRHIFQPTPSLIEYMGHICELLNIRAQIRILKPRSDGSSSKT